MLKRNRSPDTLHGDDFNIDDIDSWYMDEETAYSELVESEKQNGQYNYKYHELNIHHGFKYLLNGSYSEALGLGSAFGDEFKPVIDKIDHLTILDPSDNFHTTTIDGTSCTYVKPRTQGNMKFDDNSFDLIVILGALHHIPNVSFVLSECRRVLKASGVLIIREPIVSMGDWNKPRVGLTKRERGLPLKYVMNTIDNLELTILHKSFCCFPPLMKLCKILGVPLFNNKYLTVIDKYLSNFFIFNYDYYREKPISKISPASIYLVLQK